MFRIAFSVFLIFFLVGCLGAMRASNLTYNLDKQAIQEDSPYRWESEHTGGDSYKVYRVLAGEPKTLDISNEDKEYILGKIKYRESTNGRSGDITLSEVRHLPNGGFWRNIPIDSWIFDNDGAQIIYTVWYKKEDDGNFSYEIKGPWTDETE